MLLPYALDGTFSLINSKTEEILNRSAMVYPCFCRNHVAQNCVGFLTLLVLIFLPIFFA